MIAGRPTRSSYSVLWCGVGGGEKEHHKINDGAK